MNRKKMKSLFLSIILTLFTIIMLIGVPYSQSRMSVEDQMYWFEILTPVGLGLAVVGFGVCLSYLFEMFDE